ncbi:MAG: hypothetical protein V3V58_03930 [Nitrosopumilaceae archaeon]|jgi:ribosomal protein S27AE
MRYLRLKNSVLGIKENHKPVVCPICGSLVTPHFEPKYNGERAHCKKCGINWAES